MSEENGVQPADLFAEHLHAKLRRRVHNQFGLLRGDINGRPGAMVLRIRKELWRILLPNDRHALRSPRAQADEREGHGCARENLSPPNRQGPQCPGHGPIPNPRARLVVDRPGNLVARTYLAVLVFSHGVLGKNHRQNFFCRTIPHTPNSARTISAMLTTLRVKNLALVADLTLELQPGLNVVTGETGAGKSILIRALNLVLAERADRTSIRSASESSSVEAVFDVAKLKAPLEAFLRENGLEPCEENQLVLKRAFATGGANRQFINGSPAALHPLAIIGQGPLPITRPPDHPAPPQPAQQTPHPPAVRHFEPPL